LLLQPRVGLNRLESLLAGVNIGQRCRAATADQRAQIARDGGVQGQRDIVVAEQEVLPGALGLVLLL